MKAPRQPCKTTTDASTKNKLGCNKIEKLKPGKYRRKSSGKSGAECGERALPLPAQPYHPIQAVVKGSSFTETSLVNSNNLFGRPQHLSGKIKLQLFPIDETIQKILQQEKHNPYLELTLAPRKKISSVVQHLNTKWGSSQCARGELMLFPYNARLDNIIGFKRWTVKDSCTTAADVYVTVGSPFTFRLRYGWFSPNLLQGSCGASVTSPHSEDKLVREEAMPDSNQCSDPLSSEEKQVAILNGLSTQVAGPSALDNSVQAADNQNKVAPLSWIDCVSNISFGALLSEATPSQDGNPLPSQNNFSLHQIPVTCDSFDAAIASLIARQHATDQSTKESAPSLWDAEETCHAFPFQNRTSLSKSGSALRNDAPITSSIQGVAPDSRRVDDKQCSATGEATEGQKEEPNPQISGLDNDHNDIGRPDTSLPESSGASEPAASCSRLMSGNDSLGLGTLLGNSLDAFQNFSIF